MKKTISIFIFGIALTQNQAFGAEPVPVPNLTLTNTQSAAASALIEYPFKL